jgi:sn-glycerol 3-phosphate transport system substrate-binding protein
MADRGYYVYTGKTVDYNGEAGAFITQRFAMHLNSTAGLTNFQYYAELLNWDLGVTNFPLPNAEATNGVISGGASLWITEGHSEEELEAAREFVFYMTSAENIAQWHKASGYFPNRQESIDILEAEGFWEENPAFRIALDQMLETTPTPATGGVILGPYPQVREILETAIQSVIDQGESVDDALAAAKQLADREIEDYNLFYLD